MLTVSCPGTRLRIRARPCGERSTLARKREVSVTLPEGVERVEVRKKSGKVYTYFYWNPGRGTDREGDRMKLPNADTQPAAFWAEVKRRQSSVPTTYPAGSIGDLISRYRGSDEFTRNAEGTQSNYEVTMRRFEAHDPRGMLAIRDLSPLAVQTARRDERRSGDDEPDALRWSHDLGLGHSAWPGRCQSVRQGEGL